MERLLGNVLERQLLPVLDRYFDNLHVSQLSLFAGDVVLTNLVVRPEAIRKAGLPLAVQRGFVRELRIRIPWLRLQSEPIEVIIDTVEIVATPLPADVPLPAEDHAPDATIRPVDASPSVPAPPPATASAAAPTDSGDSWVQSLVRRALLNAALRVSNAVIKLVDGRAVASVSFRYLDVYSVDASWARAHVELEGLSKRCASACAPPSSAGMALLPPHDHACGLPT